MSSAATWDDAAADYDRIRANDPTYHECVAAAVRAIGVDPRGTVLECGCGTGLTTVPLVDRFARVMAVDYSRESLLALRQKLGPGRALLVQADIRHLPFRDGAFGRTLCANALQHLTADGQRMAAGELARVTRARLVVSVHHFSRWKRRHGWAKEGKPGQAGIDYIYRLERHELKALVPGARITAVSFEGRIGSRVWPLLPGLAARLGLGHMLIATGRPGRRPIH